MIYVLFIVFNIYLCFNNLFTYVFIINYRFFPKPEEKIFQLVWSQSKKVAAAVSEFKIFFLDSAFNVVATVQEDLAIKSALWNTHLGALLFTTSAGMSYRLAS